MNIDCNSTISTYNVMHSTYNKILPVEHLLRCYQLSRIITSIFCNTRQCKENENTVGLIWRGRAAKSSSDRVIQAHFLHCNSSVVWMQRPSFCSHPVAQLQCPLQCWFCTLVHHWNHQHEAINSLVNTQRLSAAHFRTCETGTRGWSLYWFKRGTKITLITELI